MGKTAFIFPGQGAQYIGMGKEIAQNYNISAEIFEKASETLGFNMRELVFEGSEDDLKITENTQPAILTASVACLLPIFESGVKPDVVAGLSLGEYTAHVASGTFSFEDAVVLVRKRGKFMQEAVPQGVGTMAAILGLNNEVVAESCIECLEYGIVEPANYNCPGQVVIAGEVKAVEKAVELCKQKGAKRAMLLEVSAPFHCSMLKPAGEKLEHEIKKIQIKEMGIPVVANVNAEYIQDKSQVMNLLVNQVSNPVLWEMSIRTMLEKGIETFVEIGPGKVLTGFMKKINKDAEIYNVENLETLNYVIEKLK